MCCNSCALSLQYELNHENAPSHNAYASQMKEIPKHHRLCWKAQENRDCQTFSFWSVSSNSDKRSPLELQNHLKSRQCHSTEAWRKYIG